MDKKAIAEAYLTTVVAKPGMLHTPATHAAMESYMALARECVLLANPIRASITEVANADPYKTAVDMFQAIELNRFQVSNLFCEHPLWTPAENIAFRIVHDRYGHYGLSGDNKSGFSWHGELAAYESQSRFHSPIAQRALFTEIVGQTACFSLTGEFPDQKAILLPRELDA